MGFLQTIRSAFVLTRYLNPDGKVLSTDATGLLVLVDVAAAAPYEVIPFDPTPATGEQTIDFSINDRAALFPRANVRAFNVDGDIETEITGFMKQFTRSGGLISEFYTDGIMGEGYFLLTN